jgi:hypothetical protein
MLSITHLWRRIRVLSCGSLLLVASSVFISAPALAASTVTLAWDQSTGTNIAGYKVYYGAASGNYTNSLTVGNATTASVSNLVAGATYYFAATAYDSSNLESDFSNEVGYTNAAAAPPTIVLTSPANNSTYAAPATVSLAASVTANGHSITRVRFYNGTTLLGTDTTAPYTFTWSGVTAGSYGITAQVVYDSGSTLTSAAANVTVNNQLAPAIVLTSPANNAGFAAPATITLTADVTANGHSITSVQFYNRTGLVGEATTTPFTYTWSGVPAGTYSLTARLTYDTGSILTSTAANVTVTDLATPTITMTSPASGASYTEPATISLAANVAANGHTVTKVQFYNGTTLVGEDASAPYAFTWSSVPAGTYGLTARLVYDTGTTLDSTPAVNVLVISQKPDNTPPTITTIEDQTTSQDMVTQPISFTVGDAETAGTLLTVYATSADPTIVPTNNIAIGGSETNRTVTLTPVPGATGTVAITVFVSDGSLVTNTTFQLTVQAAPAGGIPILATDGSGTISSGQDTQTMTPGQVYTVTAVPAEGQDFAGWSGSMSSSNPRLTFVMQSNLVLTARFTPRGHGSAGGTGRGPSSIYSGLFFQQDAVSLASAGSFTLSVTPRGKYTGRILLGAKRYAFSGILDTNQNSGTNFIARHNDTALTLDFQIGGSEKEQISGHLTDGTWTALLSGDLGVFGRTNPAPYAGSYTLAIPGYDGISSLPGGDSFGTFKVGSAGQVRFVGTLADGTKVSQSASISGTGYWPVHIPLYSGNGTLMNWLAFASNITNDLSGHLTWIKPAQPQSKYYPGGFTNQCDAFGSTFTYVRTEPVLNLPTACLRFCGGGLTSDITNSISISPRNQVGTPGKELKLSFSASTGTFRGSFLESATGKHLPFSGAVFQKLNAAYGVLFGAGGQYQSSEVILAQ